MKSDGSGVKTADLVGQVIYGCGDGRKGLVKSSLKGFRDSFLL